MNNIQNFNPQCSNGQSSFYNASQSAVNDILSSGITTDINLENQYRVINSLDPVNNQDLVTLSFGNSHYSGTGSGMPVSADLHYISNLNPTQGNINLQGFIINDSGTAVLGTDIPNLTQTQDLISTATSEIDHIQSSSNNSRVDAISDTQITIKTNGNQILTISNPSGNDSLISSAGNFEMYSASNEYSLNGDSTQQQISLNLNNAYTGTDKISVLQCGDNLTSLGGIYCVGNYTTGIPDVSNAMSIQNISGQNHATVIGSNIAFSDSSIALYADSINTTYPIQIQSNRKAGYDGTVFVTEAQQWPTKDYVDTAVSSISTNEIISNTNQQYVKCENGNNQITFSQQNGNNIMEVTGVGTSTKILATTGDLQLASQSGNVILESTLDVNSQIIENLVDPTSSNLQYPVTVNYLLNSYTPPISNEIIDVTLQDSLIISHNKLELSLVSGTGILDIGTVGSNNIELYSTLGKLMLRSGSGSVVELESNLDMNNNNIININTLVSDTQQLNLQLSSSGLTQNYFSQSNSVINQPLVLYSGGQQSFANLQGTFEFLSTKPLSAVPVSNLTTMEIYQPNSLLDANIEAQIIIGPQESSSTTLTQQLVLGSGTFWTAGVPTYYSIISTNPASSGGLVNDQLIITAEAGTNAYSGNTLFCYGDSYALSQGNKQAFGFQINPTNDERVGYYWNLSSQYTTPARSWEFITYSMLSANNGIINSIKSTAQQGSIQCVGNNNISMYLSSNTLCEEFQLQSKTLAGVFSGDTQFLQLVPQNRYSTIKFGSTPTNVYDTIDMSNATSTSYLNLVGGNTAGQQVGIYFTSQDGTSNSQIYDTYGDGMTLSSSSNIVKGAVNTHIQMTPSPSSGTDLVNFTSTISSTSNNFFEYFNGTGISNTGVPYNWTSLNSKQRTLNPGLSVILSTTTNSLDTFTISSVNNNVVVAILIWQAFPQNTTQNTQIYPIQIGVTTPAYTFSGQVNNQVTGFYEINNGYLRCQNTFYVNFQSGSSFTFQFYQAFNTGGAGNPNWKCSFQEISY